MDGVDARESAVASGEDFDCRGYTIGIQEYLTPFRVKSREAGVCRGSSGDGLIRVDLANYGSSLSQTDALRFKTCVGQSPILE